MEPILRSRSRRDEDQSSEMKSKNISSSEKENIKQQQPRRSLLPIFAIFVFSLFATYFYSNRSLSPSFKRISTSKFSTKDFLRFTASPPTSSQSYAICSFASYPPSKTSQKAIPRIYTVDPDQEQSHGEGGPTQCITINDGKVQSLTDGQKVQEWCLKVGKDCDVRVLDEGQSILPGLHDAHGHILDHGIALSSANLVRSTSTSEVISRLESFVLASTTHLEDPNKWIQGLGWDQTKFNPPIFPTADLFESSEILKGRKIVLKRIDVHALWVSRPVIKEVEDSLPKEVEGGLILKDDDGKPTGIFIDNAMNLIIDVQPRLSLEEKEKYLNDSIEELLSFGITNVGDAALESETYQILKKKEKGNRMKIRVWGMLDCSTHEQGPFCGIKSPKEGQREEKVKWWKSSKQALQSQPSTHSSDQVELTPNLHSEINHGTKFTLRAIKLFVDGALGSWGSAMWEDYDDRKGERGLMLMNETEVERRIRGWHERGFQVASHAIGDRANSILLDIYSRIIQESTDVIDPRFRIEHSQILRKEDVTKFGQFGIIASMQPTHCTSDMGYVETRIGKKRAREGAYVWRDLIDSSATLVFGSDFPVESPSIFEGFFSSITRLDPNLNSPHGPEGWYAEQTLSRIQTLKAFTLSASFGQFEEHLGGSLSVGKRADFVVIDRDVMDERVGVKEVRETKVLNTLIDGKVVWSRKEE